MSAARRVLVVGSGGRENALAWALSRSPSVAEVVVAPGNGGSEVPGGAGRAPRRRAALAATEPAAIVALCREQAASLVVVGPEAPLCAGAVDALAEAGIAAFGPGRAAARLEGSKAFAKRFASRHGIPTPPYGVFERLADAERYIAGRGRPVVVKADGLCAGKGVVVCDTAEQAAAAAQHMLQEGCFGEAGRAVVIEDRLAGAELSVHAVTDGESMLVLPVARDHKRVGEGDSGPNTGGMGAYAPVAVAPQLLARIEAEVLRPALAGMRAQGTPYRGVLYAGLMIDAQGDPSLLEFNVRFGDPETQALAALLDGDLADLLDSAARGRLDPRAVQVAAGRHAVVVVLAAAGYPGAARRGDPVSGIEAAEDIPETRVHHAGTSLQDGALVASGGRVLGVTSCGTSLERARERAYAAAARVHFAGMHYRRDIGGAPGLPPAPVGGSGAAP
ncbi:MAG: phosphoribosylamine--glycine ligase [Deltaproteobacteria bacterium]|nr:phosphoribosylamine--glycine ligase [Deltaproteobacteria bacterium]